MSACQFVGVDSADGVSFEDVESTYERGDTISARLVNPTDEVFNVLFQCSYLGLDKFESGSWRSVSREADVCPGLFSSQLGPGEETVVAIPYDALEEATGDAPGNYRFSSRLFRDEADRTFDVTSRSFAVR